MAAGGPTPDNPGRAPLPRLLAGDPHRSGHRTTQDARRCRGHRTAAHAESGIGYPADRRAPRPLSRSDVVAGQLLERSRHLTALRDALATVRGGSGGVLVLLGVRYRGRTAVVRSWPR